MATFLQLVNDLERESGTIYKAQRLSTVIDAPGRQEKMVAWVREAWHIIQTSRSDWPWLVKEFSASLVAGQARYTALELGIANFAGWPRKSGDFTIYDPVVGQQEEIEHRTMRYDA